MSGRAGRVRNGGQRRTGAVAVLAFALLALAAVPAAAGAVTAYPYLEATGSLVEARTRAATTALADGSVLMAGGCHYSSPQQHEGCTVRTAEVYDPESGTFGATGEMAIGRVDAAAAPLRDGRALIAGGINTEGVAPYSSAEIYDPLSGEFTATGSMAVKRWGGAAAPLPDGRVLVLGGRGAPAAGSAEIYDPETGQFSAAGELLVPRDFATAAPLSDGRVLITGDGGSAEIYDPVSESFNATGSMLGAATFLVAGAPLADGSVVVFGDSGVRGGLPREWTVQRYDPSSASFAEAPLASPQRSGLGVAPLPGGRALVAGGKGEGSTWLGHDVKPTAEIYVSAPAPRGRDVDFGAVPVGETSGPETLTITNEGAQALAVESASLSGADAAEFEIVADECSSETLAFGEECAIELAATPAGPGALSAAVELTDNAPSSPRSFALAAAATESGGGEEGEGGEGETAAPGGSGKSKTSAPATALSVGAKGPRRGSRHLGRRVCHRAKARASKRAKAARARCPRKVKGRRAAAH